MSYSAGGVDVVTSSLGGQNSPLCQHGPTLLFERFTGDAVRRFYACAACRDRKTCSFFQWADQPMSKEKAKIRNSLAKQQMKAAFTPKQYQERLKEFCAIAETKRVMCKDCGCLLLPEEVKGHESHSTIVGVTWSQLRQPTQLLPPLDNNKTNAQYLFSQETLSFLVKTLERFNFKKALCIGTPRLHEELCKRRKQKRCGIQSLLLDIDQRLENFFPKKQFCRYNMFNSYFFRGEKACDIYKSFLSNTEGSLAVIMDPPFGGMVDILAHTINQITEDWKAANEGSTDKPSFLWVFPYFMQARIHSSCPEFCMLDYKVEYENHTVFSGKSRPSTKGSPVRIFTTLNPSKVVLPTDKYRFCAVCQRYVFKLTKHCAECNACTSQDGRPYTHCSKCKRCVKPSWWHCDRCHSCHLPDFECQNPKTGCHICGEEGHKRRECPIRHDTVERRKRKQPAQKSKGKSKKKKTGPP